MRRTRVNLFVAISSLFIGISVHGAPSFSRGITIQGAIAYQDATDRTQFWYLPTSSEALLGERLKTYRVAHFGYGKAYFVQTDQHQIRSASGGIISGTFSYDLSTQKRQELLEAIKKAFNVPNPRLLPIPLRSPRVTSVLLSGIFGQFGTVEQQIPAGFQIGPEIAFSAGSASSLFAQVLANAQVGQGIQPNPAFSLNVDAKAEFVGDPWTYNIDCNLSQVWKQVRKRAGSSLSLGWFKIGSAEYQSIFQDLNKDNVCKFTQVEGSLDTATYGRQMAETMKQIFQALNDQAVNGQNFFRFEPNPEAPQPSSGGGGFSLFGWSFSVNMGYSESFFSQAITLRRTVTYTGRLEAPIAFSAVMAVACGPETKQLFADLGDTTESCITQAKIDTFQARAQREYAAKNKKILELSERLATGQINETTYEKLKALYDSMDFTDTFVPGPTLAGITFVSELSSDQIRRLEKKVEAAPTIRNRPSLGVRVLSGGRRSTGRR